MESGASREVGSSDDQKQTAPPLENNQQGHGRVFLEKQLPHEWPSSVLFMMPFVQQVQTHFSFFHSFSIRKMSSLSRFMWDRRR